MTTLERFTEIAALPGASGQEKAVATYVQQYFNALGWKTWIDDMGPQVGSDTGNLYALLEVDPAAPTLVFCSHLDTVAKPGEKIKVVAKDGVITSDGKTILGADDRAAVCAMMMAAETLTTAKPIKNILFFFSVHEEAGLMGSSGFSYDKHMEYIFNLDDGGPVGGFTTTSVGLLGFTIKITGVAAHAAQAFEKGRSAIVAAADILQQLPHGGDKQKGWSFNIGTIQGGSSANVIPDEVTLEGEMRATDPQMLEQITQQTIAICQEVAAQREVVVEFLADEASAIPAYALSDNSLVDYCEAASSQAGFSAIFSQSHSTSDASFLGQIGPTITVARGGANAHSKDETVTIKEIEEAATLTTALAMYTH